MDSRLDPHERANDLEPLLAAVRLGDKSALDAVVRDYYQQVERAVHVRLRRRFRNRGSVMAAMFSTGDIVHTVFLKVLTGRIHPEEASPARLVTYLTKAVETQIVDMTRFHEATRRDRRRHDSPTESGERLAQVPTSGLSPLEQAWGNEQRAIYSEVLQSFGPRERELLTLRIENRASFEYIASRLGFNTADAARKAYHGQKARLLVRLGARGLDLPGRQGAGDG